MKTSGRLIGRVAAWSILAVTLTGCLSRPPVTRESFALGSPPVHNPASTPGTNVLAIRSVTVSPLFEGDALVYRVADHSYEQDPYAGFLVSPARLLAIPIRDHLRNSGLFREVTEPGSALKPDQLAEIHLSELYGDFRDPKEAYAVLTLRIIFFEAPKGVPDRDLLQKDYSRRVRLKKRTAVAVVEGWTGALNLIMADLITDLKAAR